MNMKTKKNVYFEYANCNTALCTRIYFSMHRTDFNQELHAIEVL